MFMTHTAWTVTTTPITHTLCGAITYTATYEESPINTATISTIGVTYSSTARTFAMYSENLSLIGYNSAVTVSAFLTSYPTITTGPVSGTVKIIDPCLTPQSLTAPAQTNPSVYNYTGASPKLTFTSTKFVVYPPICTITYSCTMISGPRTDICNKIDGTTAATFNSSTGDYTFESIDDLSSLNYPPGSYVFQLTGNVGTVSRSATWTMTTKYTCPNPNFLL